MSPRVLLLQARLPDDPMMGHERRCFVRGTGLADGAIACHNIYDAAPSPRALRGVDALMVGGSGEYYVSSGDFPHSRATLDFLMEVVEGELPVFASCFGFHCLVHALGGRVIHDPDNTEVGTYELRLTEAGAEDPLFGSLPPRFFGQMGHKDRAERMPDGIPNLAASDRSPLQAFRIPGRNVWATQFHPELDRETNLDRFRHYLSKYAPYMDEAERDEAISRFRESPESSGLLRRFVSLVFE